MRIASERWAAVQPPILTILSQFPHHLLHFTQNLAALHQRLHRIVIVIQRPVHLQVLDVLADDFAGAGCALAG